MKQDGSRDWWNDQGTVLQILDMDGPQWNVVNQVDSAISQVGQHNILGAGLI